MKDIKTSCSDVREKLPLFVGGDLDADVLNLVRTHLAICEECASEARRARRSREVFQTSLAREASESRPDLWQGIRASLVAEGLIGSGTTSTEETPVLSMHERTEVSSTTMRPRLRLVRRAAAFAAAAAVLVAATVLAPRLVPDDEMTPGVVDGSGGLHAQVEDVTESVATELRAGETLLRPVLGESLFGASQVLRDEELVLPEQQGPDELAGYAGTGRRLR